MCKKYRDTHREQFNKTQKEWTKKNPDKVKATKKKFREKHKEEEREYHKKWIAQNPDKIKAMQKRAYGKRYVPHPRVLLTSEEKKERREAAEKDFIG